MAQGNPTSNTTEKKTGRLSIRVDEATKEVLEHAAALEGLSVSAFLLRQASWVAHKVIEEREHWRLSEQDRELFLALLDNPPAPNKALRRAAQRHKDQVQDT